MYQGKKIIQPPYLKAGDKVALVSPAYWVPQEAIHQAAETIKSWGLQPVVGPHTNSLNVDAYAGTADERAADLLWALEDDSIKAIVCSRGGYGSIHLLNRVPIESYQQHPKWLIGHGDITMLLYAIAYAGVMCIHGPMAYQIASSQEPATSITRDILFGTQPQYRIPSHPYNRSGHAEGILVGGNLSSYSAVAGTKIHLASKHDIILGTFSSIKYDLQYGCVEQMLIAHLHDYDIPVCCGFPVGSNSCIPLIEGAPCSLDVASDHATLTFNINGCVEPYDVNVANSKLIKEKQY